MVLRWSHKPESTGFNSRPRHHCYRGRLVGRTAGSEPANAGSRPAPGSEGCQRGLSALVGNQMGPLGHAGSNPAPSANFDADTGTCAWAATLGGFGSIPTGVSIGGSIRLATEAVLKTVEPRERPWEFNSLTLRQFRERRQAATPSGCKPDAFGFAGSSPAAPTKFWGVAQLVERATDIREVVGATPTVPTSLQGSSVVEQAAVNRRVAGSSPASAASFWGVAQEAERASYIRVGAGSIPASPTSTCSRVAQAAEHPVEARSVVGAIPTPRTKYRPWVAQWPEQAALNRNVAGSTPALRTKHPGVAQSGSALALGARGRWFDSSHPDQLTACSSPIDRKAAYRACAPQGWAMPVVPDQHRRGVVTRTGKSGAGFNSLPGHQFRRRSPVDRTPGYGPGSGGSSPSGGTKFAVAVAQRAERRVVTAICVGSSPTGYPNLRGVSGEPGVTVPGGGFNSRCRPPNFVSGYRSTVDRQPSKLGVAGSSPASRSKASVAQLVELLICNQRAGGSSPLASSNLGAGVAQLEERRSYKPECVGSSPTARTSFGYGGSTTGCAPVSKTGGSRFEPCPPCQPVGSSVGRASGFYPYLPGQHRGNGGAHGNSESPTHTRGRVWRRGVGKGRGVHGLCGVGGVLLPEPLGHGKGPRQRAAQHAGRGGHGQGGLLTSSAMKQRVEHPDCLSGVAGSTPVIAANLRRGGKAQGSEVVCDLVGVGSPGQGCPCGAPNTQPPNRT